MNVLAMFTENKEALNQVYNTAVGERTSLNELANKLKYYLSEFDSKINDVEIINGPNRLGDIPHSQASIEKASNLLDYNPIHNFEDGIKESVKWYWKNLA